MAGNPFEVRVPNALEALMAGDAGYKGMRGIMQEREQNAAAKEAQNALMNGGDVKSALARLIGARDFQAANALANFGNQSFNQNIQSEQLKLAQQAAQRREEPEDIRKLRAAGMDPSSPEGRKALFPRTDTPLSATDKKAVMAAEDDVPRLDATIANIERAKQLLLDVAAENKKVLQLPPNQPVASLEVIFSKDLANCYLLHLWCTIDDVTQKQRISSDLTFVATEMFREILKVETSSGSDKIEVYYKF